MNAKLSDINETLTAKNASLQQQVKTLTQMKFGRTSERFVAQTPRVGHSASPQQAGRDAPAPTMDQDAPAPLNRPDDRNAPTPPRTATEPRFGDDIRVEEIVLEPEGDVSSMKAMGEERTNLLKYVPAHFVKLILRRPKYKDPQSGKIIIAPLPPRLINKGSVDESVLAQIMVAKYLDHQPLHRQQAMYRRAGVTLARSTLSDWFKQTAQRLVPLYGELIKAVLDSGYLQVDETTLAVQDRRKKGKNHRGYFWVHHALEAGLTAIQYRPGRERKGLMQFLGDYQGAIQTDGYAVYHALDRQQGTTTHACWAHARRYFDKAYKSDGKRATHALTQIGRLYAIERELRASGADPAQRAAVRQAQSVPVLRELKQWLEDNPGAPGSPWEKAVNYTLRLWPKLCRYTENGHIEMDNNGVENVIRPIAIGRKNYLFSGSHEAAQLAAVMYSLLGSCVQQGIDPYQWLNDVLNRIPYFPEQKLHDLLPHRWKPQQTIQPP